MVRSLEKGYSGHTHGCDVSSRWHLEHYRQLKHVFFRLFVDQFFAIVQPPVKGKIIFSKYGIQSFAKMHWWLIPNHVFGPVTNITYLPWKMICVVAISWKFNVDSPLPSRLSSCKLFFLLVFFFFKVVFSLHSASSFSFPWRDGHVPRHAGSHILFSQRW